MAKLKNVDTPLGAGKYSYDEKRMPDFGLIMLQSQKGMPTLVK